MRKKVVLALVVFVFLVCIALCGVWFVWGDNLGEGEDVIQSWPTWTPSAVPFHPVPTWVMNPDVVPTLVVPTPTVVVPMSMWMCYVDIYYAEKERQRGLHPYVLCRTCLELTGQVVKRDDCTWQSIHKRMFNDGHIDRRAKRKMIKLFLSHFYVKWREFEGLPVSEPYVQAVLGHEHIVRAR